MVKMKCRWCGNVYVVAHGWTDTCSDCSQPVNYGEMRALLIEMRRYFIAKGLMTGECVAWDKVKKMFGVGQDHDCPSEDARR